MGEKINVAEILKDKKEGIRLYSPIFGDCTFCYVREDTNDICVKKHNGVIEYFNSEGLYFALGEVMLFPSKEMRVWDKFAWKKGDALSCGVDNLCIFDKWANEEYTEFYAKFVTPNYSGNTFKTEKWSKETNEAVIKQYISNIEEFKGGKLNLTTLEIEKTQPEFKDGDVVALETRYIDSDDVIVESFIVRGDYKYGDDLKFYAACSNNKETDVVYNSSIMINKTSVRKESLRLSTEEEKQQLFSALANKGKAWDAEKKQIVDLKPKCEFKPFDKVLGRNEKGDVWEAELFSHYREKSQYPFCCIGFNRKYCIPYNEETAHLLGTADEWKGGEG